MTFASSMLLCIAIVSAQDGDLRPSLSDLARLKGPDPIYQMRTRELIAQSIEQLLPLADMVAHGRVTRATPRLSADKKDIYTDYEILPLRVIRGRAAASASIPGQQVGTLPISRWGGQLTIDGVSVTQDDHDAPRFDVGEELVLLLRRKPDGTNELVSAVSGIYRVQQGRLAPLTKHAVIHDRIVNMTVAEFEAEVQRLSLQTR